MKLSNQRPLLSMSLLLLCLSLFAGQAGAQDPVGRGLLDREQEEAALANVTNGSGQSVFRTAHGVNLLDDGTLLGAGPDYEARFHPEGIEYVPALGRHVESLMPLSFCVESIRRGASEFPLNPSAEPAANGRMVEYERGAAPWRVVERYETRPDGIEQSFVFHDLPRGSGDLVVRGRVESALRAAAGVFDDGIVFELPEIGGVRIGAVTAIDARGQRAPGTLCYDGTHLDLVVPAAFVDSAALPLVLDPLIGSVFTVGSGYDDTFPDVAYDATNDIYLVVWQRSFSGGVVRIRGQRVNSSGGLVGSFLSITATGVTTRPTVANVNLRNRFLVAWQESTSYFGPWDIKARTIDAGTLAMSGVVTLAGGVGDQVEPDAGGEATLVDDDALVVWRDASAGIVGAQVQLPISGDPQLLGTFTCAPTGSWTDHEPAISKSGGSTGYYLVVWERDLSPDRSIRARCVDRNGVLKGALTAVTGSGRNESSPDVDGDGKEWLVVYEKDESLGSSSHDVHCRPYAYNSGSNALYALGPENPLDADIQDDEVDPAVAYAGLKYLCAWSDEFIYPMTYAIGYMELEPVSCTSCAWARQLSEGASRALGHPAIVAKLAGDTGAGDQGLLVYDSMDLKSGFDGDIKAHRVEAIGAGGAIGNLGGGCGMGGTLSSSGAAAVGNPHFSLVLKGAYVGTSSVFLNLALPGKAIPCGPCSLVPIQFLFLVPLVNGSITLPMPIPCLPKFIGAEVHFQFLVPNTPVTSCPSITGLSVSNGLSLTLGE